MLLQLDGPAVYGALNVTTTAQEVKVGTSPIVERKVVTIQPLDGDLYFGYDSSVTTSNGTKIFQGQVYALEASDLLTIFVIAEAGTIDVRITEVS